MISNFLVIFFFKTDIHMHIADSMSFVSERIQHVLSGKILMRQKRAISNEFL